LNKQGQTTTSILQEKTNISEQKPSEKSKSKTGQAVDKENVGGTYVI